MSVALPAEAVTVYNKKVLVVMPWQKQVNPLTAFCVGRLMDSRRTAGTMHFGDAFVAHSRNSCGDLFLQSPCEWMLTIDDDMICPFGNAQWFKANTGFNFPDKFMALNALDRLMSHGKTLVGALYFGRNPGGSPMYGEGANPQEAQYAKNGPYDLAKPTRWVGTGCMLIHRKVYEDIEKRFPRLARGPDGRGGQWFTSTEAGLLEKLAAVKAKLEQGKLDAQKAYDALAGITGVLSAAAFENPLGSGEDVSFCLRAQAAGHVPHVDMGLRCGHVGHHVY
jgi:hypothetical protein